MEAMQLDIPTPRAFVPLLEPARYKGVHGGRGSAKSHSFADLLVETAAFDKVRAVCIREVQKSLDQSVKRLLEDKIEQHGLGSRFRILRTHIESVTGSHIIFQGMQNHTANSIKSLEGYDIAWGEEAQTLSQRSLDLLRPTIRKPGSELWFSWNPDLETDPIEFLRRDPPPGATVIEMNYEDNPWFPDVLRDEMEYDKRRDRDKYSHIWRGQYRKNSEARVIKNWRVEEFTAPANASFLFGADWGFARDPSTLIRGFISGRTLYIDYEAYKVGCEIDHTPALFAGDNPRWSNPNRYTGVPGALSWRIVADSARPETISYMRKRGFNIIPAVKGPKSLKEGIEFLKSYDIVVHPRCTHTIDELTHYSFKVDPLTQQVTNELEDKKNHVIDALRYALEGIRRRAAVALTANYRVG